MPIPAGNVPTVNLDATGDSPATARADLLALVQQFNALIASQNGASGMAALDASGFLAGYGRLSAGQTWAGANTFSGSVPIVLSSGQPVIQGRNTGLALPNGLWRFFLPATDGNVYFQKNTHASGDFSTNANIFILTAADAQFSVPVAVGNATAPGHAVNLGQLSGRIQTARVANSGSASFVSGTAPAGWSVARTAVGTTVITHNLGTTLYGVAVTMEEATSSNYGEHCIISSNTFTIITLIGATPTDLDYNVIVARN